jgi:hypothetical protein
MDDNFFIHLAGTYQAALDTMLSTMSTEIKNDMAPCFFLF